MEHENKRAFARYYYETPITIRKTDSPMQVDARMFNNSVSGLYCETTRAFIPGTHLNVYISSSGVRIDTARKKAEDYRAEVIWCDGAPTKRLFCIGIRKILVFHACDMCGEKIPYETLCRTGGCVYLCPDCNDRIGRLRDITIRDSIEELLMGNVV